MEYPHVSHRCTALEYNLWHHKTGIFCSIIQVSLCKDDVNDRVVKWTGYRNISGGFACQVRQFLARLFIVLYCVSSECSLNGLVNLNFQCLLADLLEAVIQFGRDDFSD